MIREMSRDNIDGTGKCCECRGRVRESDESTARVCEKSLEQV